MHLAATVLDREDKHAHHHGAFSGTVLLQGTDLYPISAALATGQQGWACRGNLSKQRHEGSQFRTRFWNHDDTTSYCTVFCMYNEWKIDITYILNNTVERGNISRDRTAYAKTHRRKYKAW